MRILFVAPCLPIPTTGGRTRLFNLAGNLATRHQVSVLSLVQPSEESRLEAARQCCHRLELVPFEGFQPVGAWRNRLQGWMRLLSSRRPLLADTFPTDTLRAPLQRMLAEQEVDVVVLHQLFVAELVDQIEGVPVVLAQDNVESDIARRAYLSAANPVHRLRDWLDWRWLLEYEKTWLRRFAMCVAVSERDAAMLRELSPATQVRVVPNGVDVAHFAPPTISRDTDALLFFGTLNYRPNMEGLIWFCKTALPRLREARPGLSLEIVGLSPPPPVSALARWPGVRLTGFVPDIRDVLCKATACVVPLQVGGGTRLKILEALAAGCPVISTSIGAEGLGLVAGEHLLIADTPDAFVERTLALLGSEPLRRALAAAGRQLVERQYDWRAIAELLELACIQAALPPPISPEGRVGAACCR